MVRIIKNTFILIIFIGINSCYHIYENFYGEPPIKKNKLTFYGKKTEDTLISRIKFNGYYYKRSKYSEGQDAISIIFFYKNGFCTQPRMFLRDENLGSNIDIFIKSFDSGFYYNAPNMWGVYVIEDDTLKIQYLTLSKDPIFCKANVKEWHAIFLDNNDIKFYNKIDSEGIISSMDVKYMFYKYPNKPDSTNWMMFDKELNKGK